jgi:hypothetical protein
LTVVEGHGGIVCYRNILRESLGEVPENRRQFVSAHRWVSTIFLVAAEKILSARESLIQKQR